VREKFETDVASVTGPRAERILARGRLYGIGGGGHLPRVKDSKTKDASLAEVSAARSSSPQNGSPPNSPGAEMVRGRVLTARGCKPGALPARR